MTHAKLENSRVSHQRFGNGKTPMFQISLIAALVLISACKPKAHSETSTTDQAPQAAQMEASTPAVDTRVSATQQDNSAADRAPAAPKREHKTSVDTDAAAAGKVAGIAGGWVNAGGACDSGASVQFNLDGTYMSEGENGTWALEGKTLTVTTSTTPEAERVAQAGPEQSTGDSGEKAVLTVLSVTDSSASVILSNGTSANWTRCSG
jgi:hypothetical protein